MPAPTDSTVRAERVLATGYLAFRCLAVGYGVTDAAASLPHPRPAWGLAVVVAVMVEGAALVAVTLRRRAVPGIRIIWADAVFQAGLLVVGGVLAGNGSTWDYFAYEATGFAQVATGLAGLSLAAVTAVWVGLSGTYVFSALVLVGLPLWNVAPESLIYPANALVAWAVARRMRMTGRRLDDLAARTVVRATELARRQEQARQAALLHDRVLQTMEALARTGWITDHAMREKVVRKAAWLRAFVCRAAQPPGDLADLLERVIAGHTRSGRTLTCNVAGLRGLPAEFEPVGPVRDAVVVAVDRLLAEDDDGAADCKVVLYGSMWEETVVISVLRTGRSGRADGPVADLTPLRGEVRRQRMPDGEFVELRVPARLRQDVAGR